MTCGSDLPPELIARMMDFLRARRAKSTLRRCSRVCRAWVYPSQRGLFRKLRLDAQRVGGFCDLIVGAPHLGTYIHEMSFLGPHSRRQDVPEVDAGDTGTDRETIQSLLSLLPNITVVHAYGLASSSFLFTNSALRQCQRLRHFSIIGTLRQGDVVSPACIFPIFEGTAVKYLSIQDLDMPSTMDIFLNSDRPVYATERLSLNVVARNLPVWLPYFQSVLPLLKKLQVVVEGSNSVRALPAWSHSLWQTSNLSRLERFHFDVHIYTAGSLYPISVVEFPHENLFSSAPSDHLLLTVKSPFHGRNILHGPHISNMIDWYLCTLTGTLDQGGKSTLKKLTLTVMALEHSIVAKTWAKVDDTLSSPAFESLEQVRFLNAVGSRIRMRSIPYSARLLQKVLPKLSTLGKLAV